VTPLAVILYEDQRGPEKEFGLHNLVVACVVDDAGGDWFATRRMLDGRPMKGVQSLLRSCRSNIRRLSAKGQPVFALIDADAIREQLRHEGVAADADDAAITRAIKAKCEEPEKLHVFLLRENTETVIDAAGRCDQGLRAEAILQKALLKDLNARDAVLNRVAWAPDRSVRDCVRQHVPALRSMVSTLVALACGGSSPPGE
jgi:hypothetical protein